jgi:hypothetical protein
VLEVPLFASTPLLLLSGTAFVVLLNHVSPPLVPLVLTVVEPVPPAPIAINTEEVPGVNPESDTVELA